MIKVAINGAAGRMGRRLVALVSEEDDMQVLAALEGRGHEMIGRDAGEIAGIGPIGITIRAEWDAPADVLIDFTVPAGTMARLPEAVEKGAAMLIGTTGHTDDQKAQIAGASQKIPILHAPNMSVGVNVMFKTAGEMAAALGDDYDIEIVEIHHRFKEDAPSGTALRLAESIAEATGRDLAKEAVYGRHGATGERTRKEIGIHAMRGGDIVGDHTVIFSTLGERIELTHRAHTRDTFARGALRAARFLAGKQPGRYAIRDVVA